MLQEVIYNVVYYDKFATGTATNESEWVKFILRMIF